MKFQITIAVGALCAIAGAASAQGGQNGGTLSDLMEQRAQLPSTPGVRLRSVPSSNGTMLSLDVKQTSVGDALAQIAKVTGAHVIIAPALRERPPISIGIYSNKDLSSLIAAFCQRFDVEQTELAPGLTLYSEMPVPASEPGAVNAYLRGQAQMKRTIERVQSQTSAPDNEFLREEKQRRADPNYDPFVLPRGGLDPKDRFGRPIEPEPNWQKGEFNGHEFYYIPGAPT